MFQEDGAGMMRLPLSRELALGAAEREYAAGISARRWPFRMMLFIYARCR